MNISYHSWKTYKECPKKFYKQYIKKEPPTVPINEYSTLYGRLVEKFFELYCNTWCMKYTVTMPPSEVRRKVAILFESVLKMSIVDWTAFYCKYSKDEIFSMACSDICNILKSSNHDYFLNTKSEISTEVTLKKGPKINGRMDFIHTLPVKNEIMIFDGKGSNTIGKNVDNNQLLYYALLYFFQYKKLPKKLGFFYFRFNTMVPVPIDGEIINEFRANLSIDIKAITSISEYNATPSTKSCKYCNYKNGCLECLKEKAKRVRPSKIKNIESKGEIVEFGLD